MFKIQCFLLLFSSIFFSVPLVGQQIAPVTEWQKCIGGSLQDYLYDMSLTRDGGHIFVGATSSTNGDVSGFVGRGSGDIWVVKMSALNTVDWQKQIGGSNYDEAKKVIQTTDGGYLILGVTTSNDGDVMGKHVRIGDSTTADIWLVKLSSNGIIEWQKCYGGGFEEKSANIIRTTDGGYMLIGTTRSTDGDVVGNHGGFDSWVVKINARGLIQWSKCLGNESSQIGVSIVQTADGGYMTIGENYDCGAHLGSVDVWLVKLSLNGTIEWQKCFGGTYADYPTAIIQTREGGYIFTGFTSSTDVDVQGHHLGNYYDAWVVKLTNGGVIEWQRCLGGSGNDVGYSIIQTDDGNYLMLGSTNSSDGDLLGYNSPPGGWLVKLFSFGTIGWQRVLGGTGSYNVLSTVKQTIDGGYLVSGSTSSNNFDFSGNHGGVDAWVIKLSGDPNALLGQVNQTTNANCQPLTPPQYFSNGQVKIQKNNTFYLVPTDLLGRYGAFVDTGRYTISPVLPNNLWTACPSIATTINNSTRRDTAIANLSLYTAIICPQMEVQMTTPFLRRCFDNIYTINYANKGTAVQTDATAELTLDTMLTFISATKPVRSRIGNKITFALGNIGVNQVGQFDVVVNVSCNSVLGQTHCSSVVIPKTATCDTVRDTIPTIIAQCTTTCDSVSFLVKNNGNPTNPTYKYTLIANATALDTGRITLANTFTIKRKTDGRTYRLELRNVNNNQLIAARSIEQNTPPSVSTGFVNQFAAINRQINVAENCTANRGAFDPNEKSSIPTGIDTNHFVEQGSLMSYLVQFQNTGTDTAFTVIIRDTLSTLFDLNSLKMQSKSHPATWQLSPNGLLTVKFDNIKLVDSFTNEKQSHGFFTYQIRLKDSIATGTRLENKAAIYFDFNPPIITNYAWHTIGRDFLTNCLANKCSNTPTTEIAPIQTFDIYPNPNGGVFDVRLNLTQPAKVKLLIINTLGQVIQSDVSTILTDTVLEKYDLSALPNGIYLIKAVVDGQVMVRKVVVQ